MFSVLRYPEFACMKMKTIKFFFIDLRVTYRGRDERGRERESEKERDRFVVPLIYAFIH